jgi:hypothetical protein
MLDYQNISFLSFAKEQTARKRNENITIGRLHNVHRRKQSVTRGKKMN